MSTPELRKHGTLLRLNDREEDEILAQAAELTRIERRRVSKAEVIRRRAWGELPVAAQAA